MVFLLLTKFMKFLLSKFRVLSMLLAFQGLCSMQLATNHLFLRTKMLVNLTISISKENRFQDSIYSGWKTSHYCTFEMLRIFMWFLLFKRFFKHILEMQMKCLKLLIQFSFFCRRK
jgi:hypothetical protein